jgi:hypothetical protein
MRVFMPRRIRRLAAVLRVRNGTPRGAPLLLLPALLSLGFAIPPPNVPAAGPPSRVVRLVLSPEGSSDRAAEPVRSSAFDAANGSAPGPAVRLSGGQAVPTRLLVPDRLPFRNPLAGTGRFLGRDLPCPLSRPARPVEFPRGPPVARA